MADDDAMRAEFDKECRRRKLDLCDRSKGFFHDWFAAGWRAREAAQASQDANVERVRAKLRERSQVGIAKYGVTTERGDLSLSDWLAHLQEEMMDASVYIEAALSANRLHDAAEHADRQGSADVAP